MTGRAVLVAVELAATGVATAAFLAYWLDGTRGAGRLVLLSLTCVGAVAAPTVWPRSLPVALAGAVLPPLCGGAALVSVVRARRASAARRRAEQFPWHPNGGPP